MEWSSFISLDTLRELDLTLATLLVFTLITACRWVAGAAWTDFYNRLATVLFSLGLVELSVFLNRPDDPGYYIAGIFNGAIVVMAAIKANEAVTKKDAATTLTKMLTDSKSTTTPQ